MIQPGARLGPFEITGDLGAGGMGRVYSARDPRLDRDVAIKVLPAELSTSGSFRERFVREARTISQLNHPNICTVFEFGSENGVDYLVMELLQGETLADRLARGPLPLEQVFRHGIEIADALDRAHRNGIVHRDLKPGNVMLTKGGAKLLDFGLARIAAATPSESALAGETQQKPLTAEGTVVGTYQYMAPEQLAGEPADHRTDIFAFGAVLYEMLTGRRAFAGTNRTSVVTAILTSQPTPITDLQPLTPPALHHVVSKALEKDPDNRWQSAHDLASELRWIASAGSSAGMPAVAVAARRSRERVAWAAAALFLVSAAVLGLLLARQRKAPSIPVRLSVLAPLNMQLGALDQLGLALSPDGTRLVFAAYGPDGRRRLLLRELALPAAREIPETQDASYPFWSPDGNQIGFFAGNHLKRVDLRGGSPRIVSEAPFGRGGSWGADGTILFAPNVRSGIYRVPADGGTPVAVIPEDPKGQATYRWPVVLPDGKHFLFVSRSGSERAGTVHVAAIDGSSRREVVREATNAAYVDPGYLIFGRDENLFVQRFDLGGLAVSGDAVALFPEKISHFSPKNLSMFAVAGHSIAFLPSLWVNQQMQWFTRGGQQLERVGMPIRVVNAALSPDGKQVAAVIGESQLFDADVWIYDLAEKRERRLTYERKAYGFPRWSRDGKQLMFYCQTSNPADICVQSADGGEVEVVIESTFWKIGGGWTPDGSIVYSEQRTATGYDILLFRPGTGEVTPILATQFEEGFPELSRDGSLIAYTSNETGGEELFVRSLADPRRRWQISRNGAPGYVWSTTGRTLFFVGGDWQLSSVEIADAGPVGDPVPLFRVPTGAFPIGVSPDGQKILMGMTASEQPVQQIEIILNWPALLGRN